MVVVVDDDAVFRHGLADNLRDDGFAVVECADPVELASTAWLERADALITDQQMEHEEGLTLAARAHAQRPELPIIVVTAYPSAEIEARIASTSYVACLSKPLNYLDLYDWLERQGVCCQRRV